MKQNGDGDPQTMSDRVSHQIFGPARWVGPFPNGCAELQAALDKQPVSEFQLGIAGALKRYMRGFHHEFRLIDGVVREIYLGQRRIEEMDRRGVFRYLSRLLLVYSKDRNRSVRRPDTLVAAAEEMAAVSTEFADDFERQGKLEQARHFRNVAQSASRSASRYRRLRPRLGGGRPASLPMPEVVLDEIRKLVDWIWPRWSALRSATYDRRVWVRDVRAALESVCPFVKVTDEELRKLLWPERPRRKIDTLATDLLALTYRVSRQAVRQARKTAEVNLE